jgi:hypothetical protein
MAIFREDNGTVHITTGIKVEEVISIKEEEDPEPISFPVIKTEHEVSCTSYRY